MRLMPRDPFCQIATKAARPTRIESPAQASAPKNVASAGLISRKPKRTMRIETTDLRQIQGVDCGWGVLKPLPAQSGAQSGEMLTTSRCGVGKTVGLELVAQRGFENLAGRGVGNAIDEHDVVGHPPFGDLAFHEFQDVLA